MTSTPSKRKPGRPRERASSVALLVHLDPALAHTLTEKCQEYGESKRSMVELALMEYFNQRTPMIRKPASIRHWLREDEEKMWRQFAHGYDQMLRLHYCQTHEVSTGMDKALCRVLVESHFMDYPWSPAPRPEDVVASYPQYIMRGWWPDMEEREARDSFLLAWWAING